MTATVFPFPIVRRRAFIRKQVAHAALINPDAGVRYLQHQLDVQAEMKRRSKAKSFPKGVGYSIPNSKGPSTAPAR